MNQTRLVWLFQRYVTHTCTPEERLEFIQSVMASRNQEKIKELLDELWETFPHQHNLPEDSTSKILDNIFAANTKSSVVTPSPKRTPLIYKFAASLLIAIASLSAFYRFQSVTENQPIATKQEETHDEHRFIKLPDGSTVILNAGSTLNYPDSFEGKVNREVVLVGEGFFDIQSDPLKPFIVHAGVLKTTVLGTAFNIKAYDQEKDITVTVTRGKVEVSDAQKVLGVLTSNQQIFFEKEVNQVAQVDVDSKEAILWAENDIFFDDITLENATVKLEEKFAIKISFENEKLKKCRFTASFIKGENLIQILEVISQFNNAEYIVSEKGDVTLTGEGCTTVN